METKPHKISGSSKYTEDYSLEPPKKFTIHNVVHWSPLAKRLEKMSTELKMTKNIFLKSRKLLQEGKVEKTGETDKGNKRWVVEDGSKSLVVYYSKAHDSYFCDCSTREITKDDIPCVHALAAELFEMLNRDKTLKGGQENGSL